MFQKRVERECKKDSQTCSRNIFFPCRKLATCHIPYQRTYSEEAMKESVRQWAHFMLLLHVPKDVAHLLRLCGRPHGYVWLQEKENLRSKRVESRTRKRQNEQSAEHRSSLENTAPNKNGLKSIPMEPGKACAPYLSCKTTRQGAFLVAQVRP
jgi:hypothetical protein